MMYILQPGKRLRRNITGKNPERVAVLTLLPVHPPIVPFDDILGPCLRKSLSYFCLGCCSWMSMKKASVMLGSKYIPACSAIYVKAS